jgi:hypothetical protein
MGAPPSFLENAVALVNTADTLMSYKPCWHISLPCNCDFERPPPESAKEFLYVLMMRGCKKRAALHLSRRAMT